MKKRFTRLTALLLVLLMLMSAAFASGTGVTKDGYDSSLTQMIDDLSLIPVELVEPEVKTVTVDTTVLRPVYAADEGAVTPASSIAVTAQTAPDATQGYQWMISVGGVWAKIDGATAQTLNLTYAMARPAMDESGNVQLRCRIFPVTAAAAEGEEEAVYEDNITVAVNDKAEYIAQSGTMEIEVKQYTKNEEPDENYYAAREFQNAAKTPAVSTFALTAEGETPELSEYSVVINYVFENNEIAADPYTATLAAGSNFSATVTHPVVMGYLPFVSNDTETSTQINLNITNIQADVTYTVIYKPTNVNYTVIHYQQNVDDDNYTIEETETKQGLTKTTVPEVAKNYEGFYALLYEKPEIAADGSTVVEIKYDRNYYLVNFELDGGYGVEPIYARYGAEVNVGEPRKAGYTFNCWSLDGTPAEDLPKTVPAENVTYKALWQMNEKAKVSVVLWGENPNDEEYSYITTGELELESGSLYKYNGTDQLYLLCDKEAHTHTAECLKCGKEEHTTHTEACITCGITGHTHNVTCWSEDGAAFSISFGERYVKGTESNGCIGESYNYYGREEATGNKYIYIDGTWYKYTGTASVGSVVNPSCGLQESTHTHTDTCYGCEYHEHTAACYGCGKEAHTHDSNCTGTVEGLDSTLWKFVKSDTVTVNPDGSSVVNVYYDRVEYSVEFHSNQNCTNEYTSLRITAKWGENILDEWPSYNGSSSWLVEGKPNTWQNSIQIMPVGGAKFWGPKTGSKSYKAYYYVEALPGDTDTFEYNGVTYKLHHTDTSVSSGNVTDEERYAIEGFTYKEGTANGQSYNNAKFYYTRHKYAIEFYSPTTLLKKTEDIPYQSPLSSYSWTPDASQAPTQYEPDSVKFDGWYLNPECTGDKFDFATHTMPAGTKDGDTTLTLYAKWVPVNHTVSFYLDQTAWKAGTELSSHPAVTVPHGAKVVPVPAAPTNGAYTFVGWFYMEDGVEKAFDFDYMPVNKDLEVYGKWSSNVLKEYTVYFKIQGTDTQIADPVIGSGLAGTTKTFDAKGDTELYADYQEGYFPLVKSHSMTLDITTPEMNDNQTEYTDTEGNTWTRIVNADGTAKIVQSFTFEYVQKDAVPYTVYYVTESQNAAGSLKPIELDGKTYYIVAETYTNSDNRKAVVTEKFKQVSGYMPDAYQKRLVVDGSEGADNKIIFIYSVDAEHAYYKITHYTQNLDGQTWTEYASSQAVGNIGETYTAEPLTIDGFTYDSKVEETVESGELTANGLELKLYYTRNEYPYEVRYLEKDTGTELADPMKGAGKYGQVISESAIDIAGYTAVTPTSQTMVIKIEESQTVATLNIITFYYEEQEATINYVVVGPEGLNDDGTPKPPVAGNVSPVNEKVKVLTGTAQGSTATASSTTYKFVGWYKDADCTQLVDTTWVNVNKITPEKTKDYGETGAVKLGYENATYYAKFDWNVSTLKITKTGMQAGESAIFTVTADGKTYTIVLTGPSASATISGLTIGSSYMVTEQTDWSWSYTVKSSKNTSGTISAGGSTASFTNTKTEQWLYDESIRVNSFNKTTATE